MANIIVFWYIFIDVVSCSLNFPDVLLCPVILTPSRGGFGHPCGISCGKNITIRGHIYLCLITYKGGWGVKNICLYFWSPRHFFSGAFFGRQKNPNLFSHFFCRIFFSLCWRVRYCIDTQLTESPF